MKPNLCLKYEREQHGWSQARVAEQIGTDAGNVSRWERGYSSPSPYYRERLSFLFGKEVHELGLLIEDDHASPLPDPPDQGGATSGGQRSETLAPASRILAGLSYSLFWWTGLLISLFLRKNRFVLFHSLQSTLLFGCVTLLDIALIVISSFTSFELIRVLAVLCFLFLNIGAAVAWIVGIVMALRGRYYTLPLVGDFGIISSLHDEVDVSVKRESPRTTG